MQLRGLGYLGLYASDLTPWPAFAEELMGLMPADRLSGGDADVRGDSLLYRLDGRRWRLAVHRGERPGLAYLGWELPDRHALAVARGHLEDCGVVFEDAGERTARGVSDLIRFRDPWGHAHELFYGAPTELDAPFASPAGISGFLTENGMGHVMLAVPDAHEAEEYFAKVLNFSTTDRMDMGGGKRTIFMRTRVRHHALALTDVLPDPGFHHVMLEADLIQDVGRAWDRVQQAGTPITMTLGQHSNDPMISFYVESPSPGCGFELGFGGMLVDETSWVVREVGPTELWGHRGAAMDEIEAGGGRA